MTEPTTIALVHPGAMGSGIGAVLVENGHRVLYASENRSDQSVARAAQAGLVDVGNLSRLTAASLVVSICPPHAAVEVARSFGGFTGTYVDANAIAPATADEIRSMIEAGGGTYVDGSIVGSPPNPQHPTTLYLSGHGADEVAPVFSSVRLGVRVLDGASSASALKMAVASWSKGSNTLLLATYALAVAHGVGDELIDQLSSSTSGGAALVAQLKSGASTASRNGWRWVGEMREIAETYRQSDLPTGFHEAAAETFERAPFNPSADVSDETLRTVVAALLGGRERPSSA